MNVAATKKPRDLVSHSIDLRRMMTTAPAPADEVLRGLEVGMVGIILGAGGIGKSILTMLVCQAIATGIDRLDCLLSPGVQRTGQVVVLAGEDGVEQLHRRIFAFGSTLGSSDRERMADHVRIVPLVGEAPAILAEDGTIDLVGLSELRLAAKNSRLLIIDPLSQFHRANENANSAMTELIKALSRIAKDERCAIIVVHHVTKSSMKDGSDEDASSSRGASAITDNARWVVLLRRLTIKEFTESRLAGDRSQYVLFSMPKANYSKSTVPKVLKRAGFGLFEQVGSADSISSVRSRKSSARRAEPADVIAPKSFEDADLFGAPA